MTKVTFHDQPYRISGALPAVGKAAPTFSLTGADLADVGLEAFAGKKKILNIVPSLDTGVCALSAKAFHAAVKDLSDTVVLNISMDLPFASKRFCDAEKLTQIIPLSAFRSPAFGKDYGVRIEEGPLAGLLARVVVVLDTSNRIVYRELVPEIAQEPNYDAALAAVRS